MIEENNREYHYEHKSHWLRTLGVILATLIGAFLAFYFVADMTFNRMTDPSYQMRKMEKMMRQAIRTAEAYFNSDRMVIEYYNRLYKPIAHDDCSAGEKKKELNISETPTFDAWTYSNIK